MLHSAYANAGRIPTNPRFLLGGVGTRRGALQHHAYTPSPPASVQQVVHQGAFRRGRTGFGSPRPPIPVSVCFQNATTLHIRCLTARHRASSTQWVDEWPGTGLRPGASNTGHFTYSPTSVCPRPRPSATHAQPAAVEPSPRIQHVKGCLVPERNLRDTDSLMPDLALAAARRHSHAASPCPLRSCSFSLAKDVIIGQLQGASAAKLHGERA